MGNKLKKPVIFLIILFVIMASSFLFKRRSVCKNKQATSYKLENKNYCLLIADNSFKWGRGLMNYRKPVDFDGMIFIFPNKEIRSFWNMDTFMDLKLYWLSDEQIVGKSDLPSIEKTKDPLFVNSKKAVNKVIELIK